MDRKECDLREERDDREERRNLASSEVCVIVRHVQKTREMIMGGVIHVSVYMPILVMNLCNNSRTKR
jgi:hypothetical protein